MWWRRRPRAHDLEIKVSIEFNRNVGAGSARGPLNIRPGNIQIWCGLNEQPGLCGMVYADNYGDQSEIEALSVVTEPVWTRALLLDQVWRSVNKLNL